MNSDVSLPVKFTGTIIEYLDQGRLKAALVTREQERHLAVIDSAGHERLVPRDLVLMRHPERSAVRRGVDFSGRTSLMSELAIYHSWRT